MTQQATFQWNWNTSPNFSFYLPESLHLHILHSLERNKYFCISFFKMHCFHFAEAEIIKILHRSSWMLFVFSHLLVVRNTRTTLNSKQCAFIYFKLSCLCVVLNHTFTSVWNCFQTWSLQYQKLTRNLADYIFHLVSKTLQSPLAFKVHET